MQTWDMCTRTRHGPFDPIDCDSTRFAITIEVLLSLIGRSRETHVVIKVLIVSKLVTAQRRQRLQIATTMLFACTRLPSTLRMHAESVVLASRSVTQHRPSELTHLSP
jgi:hypothetical protein